MAARERKDQRKQEYEARRELEKEFRYLMTERVNDANKKAESALAKAAAFEAIAKQLALDLAVVQLKAGFWGTAGGLGVVLAAYLLKRLLS